MYFIGVAAIVVASSTNVANVPSLVDSNVVDYFRRAVAYAGAGEHQKSLAMLKSLIAPRSDVRVDYSNIPESLRPTFQAGIENGLKMWRDVLGSDMPFTVSNRPDAPITVRFVDAINSHVHAGMDCKGEITLRRRIQWGPNVHYYEVTAEINVVRFSQGRKWMTSDEIAHVTAHELGHALGLGDVQEDGKLMGPMIVGKPIPKVSAEEADAVRYFRALVRREIARVAALADPRPKAGHTAGPIP